MVEESKNKIEYIDIARGIAIILMIIGHVITVGSTTYNVIYSFHMPLFIFTSGMFFKERDVKSFAINIIKKLLFPYIVVVLIADICKGEHLSTYFYQIMHSDGNTLGVLWFMPFLAMIKSIFYILKKISKNNDLLLYIFCFLCVTFSYVLSLFKKYDALWDVSLFAIMYYYIGYLVMKYDLLEKILDNKKVMIVLFILWVIGANVFRDLIKREYANGYITIIIAVCGCLVALKLSKIILNKFSKLAKILAWYGKNTLYVLLFHYMEWGIVKYDKIFPFPYKTFTFITKMVIVTVGVTIKDFIFVVYDYYCNKRSTKENE